MGRNKGLGQNNKYFDSSSALTLFLLFRLMVLDFSLELKTVEAICKGVENRLKEKQEGEARIIYIKSFLQE